MARTKASIAAVSVLLLLLGCASSESETRKEPTARPASTTTEVVKGRPSGGLYWTERAYPTGEKGTSVILLESGTPTEVSQGAPYEYVLKVTNISDMNLDNVVVLDKPEGNFKLHGSTPRTEPAAGDDLRWNIGSLKPKQTREIKISGSAIAEGQVTHCAEVDWRSLFCSTTQVTRPELSITKKGTAVTLVCDPITYEVTVSNTGSGVTRNVVIEDVLPEGVATLEGKRSVQYSLPTLSPGESKTFTWKAKAQRTGRFTNAAMAKADGNLSARTDPITTTVTRPVLDLDKTATKQTYMGRVISYDMTLRNTGDGEARDVVVSDPLPAGTRFVGATEGGTLDGNVVRWRLGSLAPGAIRTFGMKVSSSSAMRVRNTATATAYCAEAVSRSADTDVVGIAAILLEVVDLTDPVMVGDKTTYLITVTNQGSTPDTNIRILVNLEDTMSYVGATGATATEDTGARIAFRPLASLAPGDKATWRVEVKAVREGDVRIKVALTSDQLTRPVEETEATKLYR